MRFFSAFLIALLLLLAMPYRGALAADPAEIEALVAANEQTRNAILSYEAQYKENLVVLFKGHQPNTGTLHQISRIGQIIQKGKNERLTLTYTNRQSPEGLPSVVRSEQSLGVTILKNQEYLAHYTPAIKLIKRLHWLPNGGMLEEAQGIISVYSPTILQYQYEVPPVSLSLRGYFEAFRAHISAMEVDRVGDNIQISLAMNDKLVFQMLMDPTKGHSIISFQDYFQGRSYPLNNLKVSLKLDEDSQLWFPHEVVHTRSDTTAVDEKIIWESRLVVESVAFNNHYDDELFRVEGLGAESFVDHTLMDVVSSSAEEATTSHWSGDGWKISSGPALSNSSSGPTERIMVTPSSIFLVLGIFFLVGGAALYLKRR